MLFDEAIKGEIDFILQTTPPFNDPFVKKIRDLKTDYGFKINLVVRNSWSYPCRGCKLPPRKMRFDGDITVEEETEDEHCCSCSDSLDIKYMSIPQLETYVKYRSTEFKKKDLIEHQENSPLYKVLNPELVSLPTEEKQMEKPILSIT